jgi:hypothetical protein
MTAVAATGLPSIANRGTPPTFTTDMSTEYTVVNAHAANTAASTHLNVPSPLFIPILSQKHQLFIFPAIAVP